jgi:DNA-binding NarL/FixJ family response regulator
MTGTQQCGRVSIIRSPWNPMSPFDPSPGRASASSTPPSVLLVDDHPLYREALADLLRRVCEEPLGIVHADSAEAALQLATLHPRIGLVVIDLNLPGAHGTEAIIGLRCELPSATIIVVSGSDHRRDIQAAMRAGARAFVSKSVAPHVMLSTLRRALRARIHSPEVITRDIADIPRDPTGSDQFLTDRQREVLLLMSKGHTNKEIGLRMGLAEITIKQHVSRILAALKVTNRIQAVMTARRMVLDLPSPDGQIGQIDPSLRNPIASGI